MLPPESAKASGGPLKHFERDGDFQGRFRSGTRKRQTGALLKPISAENIAPRSFDSAWNVRFRGPSHGRHMLAIRFMY